MKDGHLDEMIGIIEWWRELPADYTGLNDVMHKQQKLSGHLYTFVDTVLRSKGDKMAAAKGDFYSKKYSLRVKEHSKGTEKARNISLANTWKEFEIAEKAEQDYWATQKQVDAIKEILSAMAQKVSYLKEELNYSRYSNQP